MQGQNQALATRPTAAIETHDASSYSRDQVELIKRTIAKGATDDELALFVGTAKRLRLDPFARQIFAIKRWDPDSGEMGMTTHISVDGLRLIADRTEEYLPAEDLPDFRYNAKNELVSATVYVWKWRREAWHKVPAIAFFDEYAGRKKNGDLTKNWRDKPHIMLAKCAEALAIRKAFPNETSGVYIPEEFGGDDEDQPAPKMTAPPAPPANQQRPGPIGPAPTRAAAPPPRQEAETRPIAPPAGIDSRGSQPPPPTPPPYGQGEKAFEIYDREMARDAERLAASSVATKKEEALRANQAPEGAEFFDAAVNRDQPPAMPTEQEMAGPPAPVDMIVADLQRAGRLAFIASIEPRIRALSPDERGHVLPFYVRALTFACSAAADHDEVNGIAAKMTKLGNDGMLKPGERQAGADALKAARARLGAGPAAPPVPGAGS